MWIGPPCRWLTVFIVFFPCREVPVSAACLQDEGPVGDLAEERTWVFCQGMQCDAVDTDPNHLSRTRSARRWTATEVETDRDQDGQGQATCQPEEFMRPCGRIRRHWTLVMGWYDVKGTSSSLDAKFFCFRIFDGQYLDSTLFDCEFHVAGRS